MDIQKASNTLSEIDIDIAEEHLQIKVLWFRVMTCEDQWEIKRHRHTSYEFHYVADGDSVVTLDDGSFTVEKGQMYMTPPGVSHAQVGHQSGRYTEYSLNCDVLLRDDERSEQQALYQALADAPCRPISDIQPLLALFEEALQEAHDKKLGFQLTIRSIVKRLLIESIRRMSDERRYEGIDQFKRTDYRFVQIERYIQDNLHLPLRVADVAAHLHLSERQVNRIVQRYRAMSTKQLMSEMKLSAARHYLSGSDLSVTDIAERLGFSSLYYFDQFFRKYMSRTPTSYRMMSENHK